MATAAFAFDIAASPMKGATEVVGVPVPVTIIVPLLVTVPVMAPETVVAAIVGYGAVVVVTSVAEAEADVVELVLVPFEPDGTGNWPLSE